MDYKQIIDGMKWVRSPREIEVSNALHSAKNPAEQDRVLKDFLAVITEPPLRKTGLEAPVFYAFQARAEWEILGLADGLSERLQEDYNLHPAGQSGIGLDWLKLNERIWIPADYLEAGTISPDARAIFSCDESNCFGSWVKDRVTAEDLQLKRKILYGTQYDPTSKYDATSESKIKALLTDSEWRVLARTYSLRLLFCAGSRYELHVNKEFLPVLEALIVGFQAEMK